MKSARRVGRPKSTEPYIKHTIYLRQSEVKFLTSISPKVKDAIRKLIADAQRK